MTASLSPDELRRNLHAHPELSGFEAGTARILRDALLECRPSRVLEGLGGHGLAAVFEAPDNSPGPTVALRAELDALATLETTARPHASQRPGVAHACGHDGHMAALYGVALKRQQRPLARGRLVLLFQPAEETGQGARAVIADARWQDLAIDHIYAVHNLPGQPLGQVQVHEGVFTAASVGLTVRLRKLVTHAEGGEPGPGPAQAMSQVAVTLSSLPAAFEPHQGLTLATVTATNATDGEADFLVTLRAEASPVLQEMRQRAAKLVRETAARHRLRCEMAWVDEFPVTRNDDLAVATARAAATTTGLVTGESRESPLRWSEDFGWLIDDTPSGALVCLGAGQEQPLLHAPDYDFPDRLLPVAVSFYEAILAEIGLVLPSR